MFFPVFSASLSTLSLWWAVYFKGRGLFFISTIPHSWSYIGFYSSGLSPLFNFSITLSSLLSIYCLMTIMFISRIEVHFSWIYPSPFLSHLEWCIGNITSRDFYGEGNITNWIVKVMSVILVTEIKLNMLIVRYEGKVSGMQKR